MGIRSILQIPGAPGSVTSMSPPPYVKELTVPKPVMHWISEAWAILPISLYVRGNSIAWLSAKPVVNAPPALVPKPMPMGTSMLCSTETAYFLVVWLRSVSTTCLVVFAWMDWLLMVTLTLFSFASLTVTLVWTPLSSPNPPPVAPIFVRSVIGLPFIVSWISKKLEMAPGANALAVLVTVVH